MSSCFMVGIAGGSCVGKGYLCKQIQGSLPESDVRVLSMDSYYKDLSHIPMCERHTNNFDIPDALDIALLVKDLKELNSGGAVSIPVYDFETHTRTSQCDGVLAHGGIVLVEGLFALYWQEVRQLLSLKIFLDLDSEICLSRRIERDVTERGRTPQSVRQQFRQTVLPMYDRYVAPTRSYADIVLSGDTPVGELGAKVVELISEKMSI